MTTNKYLYIFFLSILVFFIGCTDTIPKIQDGNVDDHPNLNSIDSIFVIEENSSYVKLGWMLSEPISPGLQYFIEYSADSSKLINGDSTSIFPNSLSTREGVKYQGLKINNLPPGNTYYFRVATRDSVGNMGKKSRPLAAQTSEEFKNDNKNPGEIENFRITPGSSEADTIDRLDFTISFVAPSDDENDSGLSLVDSIAIKYSRFTQIDSTNWNSEDRIYSFEKKIYPTISGETTEVNLSLNNRIPPPMSGFPFYLGIKAFDECGNSTDRIKKAAGIIKYRVHSLECSGCGSCELVCEESPPAIRVIDNKAVIDPDRCTQCGNCFNECKSSGERAIYLYIQNYEAK